MAHSCCHLYWQAVHLFTESLNQILVLRLQKAQQRWRRGVNYSLFMHPVPLCMAGVIFPCSRVTLTLQSSVAHSGAQNRIFITIYTSNIFDSSAPKIHCLVYFVPECADLCVRYVTSDVFYRRAEKGRVALVQLSLLFSCVR